jgi:uncharacterized cupin superfamily protein
LPAGGFVLAFAKHPENTTMPKLDISAIPKRQGSSYPAPFAALAAGRIKQALGNAAGLHDFGVNLVHLPPGGWSSQRHWHSGEDEFVCILSGELVLVTGGGEALMRPGDCAAFARNDPDAHHFINRGSVTAIYLEVGSRNPDDVCSYPDIDLHLDKKKGGFTHKDGTPYA